MFNQVHVSSTIVCTPVTPALLELLKKLRLYSFNLKPLTLNYGKTRNLENGDSDFGHHPDGHRHLLGHSQLYVECMCVNEEKDEVLRVSPRPSFC